jgi:hypothetical protein
MNSRTIVSTLAITAAMLSGAPAAQADPTAAPGYSISVFAPSLAGTSAADSVEVIGNDVYVGYGNGGAPDGSGGAVSTIAEYNSSGQLLNTTTVVGHNDGLRYDASTGQIWAIQNEDANTNVVLITPGTLAKSAPISLTSVNGGGFDDALFQNGQAFLSASNPANNPNAAPAIVSATLNGSNTAVTTTPALAGNASATLLNNGTTTTLNLQDPDSLSQTIGGVAVLTSQGDSQLIFVNNLGTTNQSVGVLALNGPMVDDTAFGGTHGASLLVVDKTTNVIYRISGPFNPNFGYSAAQDSTGTTGFIADFNATNNATIGNGFLGDVVTGLGNPGGEAFIAGVPEPSTWAMMLIGFAGLGFAGYRKAQKFAAKAS